jgi:DNA-binding NarL/FixJ family response regulator
MTVRVVVADDQALVRVGFCGIIAATPGFTVVGEAGNGAEAVEAARRTRPDVILMDVRMPVMDGIEATRQITASTDVRALILTTFDLDEYVFEGIRAGAAGFLVKDTDPDELVQAVRVVADGGALLSPGVTRRLIGEFASRAKPPQPAGLLGELTDREREVLDLVAQGRANPVIATRLGLSQKTVRNHVSNILTKLQVADRAQAIVQARDAGLGHQSRV